MLNVSDYLIHICGLHLIKFLYVYEMDNFITIHIFMNLVNLMKTSST